MLKAPVTTMKWLAMHLEESSVAELQLSASNHPADPHTRPTACTHKYLWQCLLSSMPLLHYFPTMTKGKDGAGAANLTFQDGTGAMPC